MQTFCNRGSMRIMPTQESKGTPCLDSPIKHIDINHVSVTADVLYACVVLINDLNAITLLKRGRLVPWR